MDEKGSYRINCFDSTVHSAAEIARIHLKIRQWQEENQNNMFRDIYSSQDDIKALEERYLQSGGNFFVAQDIATDRIIGFVGIKVDDKKTSKTGVIKRLAVIPEYHRRGIATALMETAISWAKSNKFSKLTLTTGMRENAKPIYEKCGFVEVGRVTRNNDYMMDLDLSQSP